MRLDVEWNGMLIGALNVPDDWTAGQFDPDDTGRDGQRAEMILFGRDALYHAMWEPKTIAWLIRAGIEDRGPAHRHLVLTRAITSAMLKHIGIERRDESLESDMSISCMVHYGLAWLEKRPCCERDHNNDGNCDIHAAPGVPRSCVR